jgi:cytidine deaminase
MSSALGAGHGRRPRKGERALFDEAARAAVNAYAPYSGLSVGAAVTGSLGLVHVGVNVENASFPAGLCAERVALGAAVAAGERALAAVAVATADGRDAVPCGACLQALAEFGDPEVVCRVGGRLRVLSLHELLTAPFAAARREEASSGPALPGAAVASRPSGPGARAGQRGAPRTGAG